MWDSLFSRHFTPGIVVLQDVIIQQKKTKQKKEKIIEVEVRVRCEVSSKVNVGDKVKVRFINNRQPEAKWCENRESLWYSM